MSQKSTQRFFDQVVPFIYDRHQVRSVLAVIGFISILLTSLTAFGWIVDDMIRMFVLTYGVGIIASVWYGCTVIALILFWIGIICSFLTAMGLSDLSLVGFFGLNALISFIGYIFEKYWYAAELQMCTQTWMRQTENKLRQANGPIEDSKLLVDFQYISISILEQYNRLVAQKADTAEWRSNWDEFLPKLQADIPGVEFVDSCLTTNHWYHGLTIPYSHH